MMHRFLIAWLWLLAAPFCQGHPMMTAYVEMLESEDGATSVIWRHPVSSPGGMTLEPRYPTGVSIVATSAPQFEGAFVRERYLLRGAPQFWSGCIIGLKGSNPDGVEVLVRLELANGQKQVAVLAGAASVFTGCAS